LRRILHYFIELQSCMWLLSFHFFNGFINILGLGFISNDYWWKKNVCLFNFLNWIPLANNVAIFPFYDIIWKDRRSSALNLSENHYHTSMCRKKACFPQWLLLNGKRVSESVWYNQYHSLLSEPLSLHNWLFFSQIYQNDTTLMIKAIGRYL